ncbi:sulfatase family protein [Maribacter sp. HTCC2170]|uniref:sulfatase family protein n=1 Tax=Maribacter sp. (strain HTCC2170 / KCCM 42371) TaxID=313603 RepID=UPI000325A412|nr:arylsulfatase [Maribacter sp. HTCC2170]
MFRSVVFAIFCIVLLVGCSEKTQIVKKQKPPNIVYILADDLGYGDISAFNAEGKIQTPNIDNLAKDGMKFTDAHTSSAVCTPTRYGILTGRYNWRSPIKSGVLTGKSEALIPNSRTTVASFLSDNGYKTGFIGKWHLGWDWAIKDSTNNGGEGWNATDFENLDFTKPVTNTPNDLGFDYAYGHSGSLDMAPYVYVENGMATAKVDTVTVDKGKYTWWREGPTAADFVHDEVTPNFFRKSMSFIKEQGAEEQPFFLYLALPSPHTPILPTEEWQGKSNLNPYADFVVMIDDYLGQLVEVLEQKGLAENTIVIFTSDNGCSPQADFKILGDLGHDPSAIYRGHKADIYEGGHRIPFVVKWPSKIESGSVSDKTICTTDLLATVADILNVDLLDNQGEDSFSILPLLDTTDKREFKREATVHHSINGSFALRKANWKMIFCTGSGGWSDPKPNSEGIEELPKFQLYDLANDPSEQTNLFGHHPDIEGQLSELMLDYIDDGRSTPGKKQTNEENGFGNEEWNQLTALRNNILEK